MYKTVYVISIYSDYIYIRSYLRYIYMYTTCVSQLAKASDIQLVRGSSLVRTNKIGIQIIFRSNII